MQTRKYKKSAWNLPAVRAKYPKEAAEHDAKQALKREREETKRLRKLPAHIQQMMRTDGAPPTAADSRRFFLSVARGEHGSELRRILVEHVENLILPAPWLAQRRLAQAQGTNAFV